MAGSLWFCQFCFCFCCRVFIFINWQWWSCYRWQCDPCHWWRCCQSLVLCWDILNFFNQCLFLPLTLHQSRCVIIWLLCTWLFEHDVSAHLYLSSSSVPVADYLSITLVSNERHFVQLACKFIGVHSIEHLAFGPKLLDSTQVWLHLCEHFVQCNIFGKCPMWCPILEVCNVSDCFHPQWLW